MKFWDIWVKGFFNKSNLPFTLVDFFFDKRFHAVTFICKIGK